MTNLDSSFSTFAFMFRPNSHGCSRFKPTIRLISIIFATIILIFELSLATFEYIKCRNDGNPLSATFAGLFTIHSFFTILYIIGAFRLVECFMVPWLTIQLIFLTTFSLFVIVWWIATLLSIFGLVEYYTPSNGSGLTNPELFVLIGSILTITLLITIKISHILYKGFVKIRNQNIACYRISSTVIERNGSVLKPSYV